MEQGQSFLNEFEEKQKYRTLKTLTVLTFIGCGLGIIGAVWSFATMESSYQKMQGQDKEVFLQLAIASILLPSACAFVWRQTGIKLKLSG